MLHHDTAKHQLQQQKQWPKSCSKFCQKFHGILIELKRDNKTFIFDKFGLYMKRWFLPIIYGTFLLHVINSRLKKSLSFRQRAEPQSMLPLTESLSLNWRLLREFPFAEIPRMKRHHCLIAMGYLMSHKSWWENTQGSHDKLSWSRKEGKLLSSF